MPLLEFIFPIFHAIYKLKYQSIWIKLCSSDSFCVMVIIKLSYSVTMTFSISTDYPISIIQERKCMGIWNIITRMHLNVLKAICTTGPDGKMWDVIHKTHPMTYHFDILHFRVNAESDSYFKIHHTCQYPTCGWFSDDVFFLLFYYRAHTLIPFCCLQTTR